MKPQEHPLLQLKESIEPLGFRIGGLGYNGNSLLIHIAGGAQPRHELHKTMLEKEFTLPPQEAIQIGEDLQLNKKLDDQIKKLKEKLNAKQFTSIGGRQFILSRFGQTHRKAAIQLLVDTFRQQQTHIPNLDHQVEDFH